MKVLAIGHRISDFTEFGAFSRQFARFCRQYFPKFSNKIYLLLVAVLALLPSIPKSIQGQYAQVKHITAKTAEGVSVSIWVDNQTVKFGQDVVVKYKIDRSEEHTSEL